MYFMFKAIVGLIEILLVSFSSKEEFLNAILKKINILDESSISPYPDKTPYDGVWKSGNWKNGTWKEGLWVDGTWEGGTWLDGVWVGGDWIDGIWETGLIYDPEKKGNFEKDWEWSDEDFVKSPINPKDYFDSKYKLKRNLNSLED